MLKSELFDYYKKCSREMENAYDIIKSHFNVAESVAELMKLRGYPLGGAQEDLFTEMQICACNIEDSKELGAMAGELGLAVKGKYDLEPRFLLNDRFIIPIRDLDGNLVSMVGYYPDYKKYITTPSPFFSKECLFFNLDDAYRRSYAEYDGFVILVEGMFDCLSLRALGLPAIATMGSDVSKVKCELLRIFKKVIYVPDNDAVGRRALNRYDKKYGWHVPETATGVKLKGYLTMQDAEGKDVDVKVKDTDNLVSWFDEDDVIDFFVDVAKSKELYVELNL